MQNKIFSLLSAATLLFIVGCGDSTSPDKPAAAVIDTPATAAVVCASSALATNSMTMFGNPVVGGDTVDKSGHAILVQCANQGICQTNSADANAVPVSFNYTRGTAASPSTLVMSVPYALLFKRQPEVAIFLYNNGPIAKYQFLSKFPLSRLGGTFATVCDTIQPSEAGAGSITYNPPITTQPPPTNANMKSVVTITYTMTPSTPQ